MFFGQTRALLLVFMVLWNHGLCYHQTPSDKILQDARARFKDRPVADAQGNDTALFVLDHGREEILGLRRHQLLRDKSSSDSVIGSLVIDPHRSSQKGQYGCTTKRSLIETNITARPMFETYDCHHRIGSWYHNESYEVFLPPNCTLVSNSSGRINMSDSEITNAYNHAIDVCDLYMTLFNQNSMDGKGMTIKSRVHYGNYTGGFSYWDVSWHEPGIAFTYSEGDGYAATCLDIVAEQLSWFYAIRKRVGDHYHYWWESEVLQWSFSATMAAAADRLVANKNQEYTWRLYEDCDLEFGRGWYNMADPTESGIADHYDDRERDYSDGFIDKWFYLMVNGGTHPRSNITVPALHADFDLSMTASARIVYKALDTCEYADFIGFRECTLNVATSSSEVESVAKAWDSIGVFPPVYLPGIPRTGLTCGIHGESYDQLFFRMNETVPAGWNVTCLLEGPAQNSTNARFLSVGFGRRPNGRRESDCQSRTLEKQQSCTTGPAPANNSLVYVTLMVRKATTNMTLECYMNDGCKSKNQTCKSKNECCGTMICDGPSKNKKVCKPCIDPCPPGSLFCGRKHACASSRQCCKGSPKCLKRRCTRI